MPRTEIPRSFLYRDFLCLTREDTSLVPDNAWTAEEFRHSKDVCDLGLPRLLYDKYGRVGAILAIDEAGRPWTLLGQYAYVALLCAAARKPVIVEPRPKSLAHAIDSWPEHWPAMEPRLRRARRIVK